LIELAHPTATIVGAGVLTNEAELRGTGAVEIAVINAAGGQINAVNDLLTFTQTLTNHAGAQINAINSTLDFQAGLTNNGQLNLINTTILGDISGGPSGAASFVGDNSVGGNLAMAAGDSLAIRLGGTAPAQFDSLAVGGDAEVNGSLSVSLAGGFALAPSQAFTILDVAGSTSGAFNDLFAQCVARRRVYAGPESVVRHRRSRRHGIGRIRQLDRSRACSAAQTSSSPTPAATATTWPSSPLAPSPPTSTTTETSTASTWPNGAATSAKTT
jgi:hypothetical protein